MVLVTGILTGGACYHLSNTLSNEITRSGVLYFLVIIYTLLPFTSLSLFIYDRQFYSKEVAAKLYASMPYYLANMTVETIFNGANVLVSGTIAYYMIDLGNSFANSGEQYGVFIGIIVLLHIVASQWVQLCGLMMPNQDMAFALGASYVVAEQLFAGFLISSDNFTWLGFFQWIDFLKYAWNALMHNEFDSLDYNMDYRLSVLNTIKLNSPGDVWVDALALLGFWLVFHVLGFLSLHFLHREQR